MLIYQRKRLNLAIKTMRSMIIISLFKCLSLVLLCLSLTLWQIFKGINKYLSFPQGSRFQSDFKSQLSKESLPDLRFCSEMNYHGIYDMSNLLMLLINSIRYWTGTCHPTVCFKTRSIQVYPQVVKPQNIHHAMPLT